mgnify:CR=1 FL=1
MINQSFVTNTTWDDEVDPRVLFNTNGPFVLIPDEDVGPWVPPYDDDVLWNRLRRLMLWRASRRREIWATLG